MLDQRLLQENFEVGQDVYDAFEHHTNRPAVLSSQKEKGKYGLDVQVANVAILRASGLQAQNIIVEDENTYTSSTLHSARRMGKDYPLNAIIVESSRNMCYNEKNIERKFTNGSLDYFNLDFETRVTPGAYFHLRTDWFSIDEEIQTIIIDLDPEVSPNSWPIYPKGFSCILNKTIQVLFTERIIPYT